MKNKYKLTILLIILLTILSCRAKLISDYDRDTAYKIVEISKMVDLFYMNITERDSTERTYSEFAEEYKNIEVELRVLVMMNKMRTKNEESVKISEHILQNWLEFKVAHRQNDAYKNSFIDVDWSTIREQFYALAVVEAAKK